MSDESNEDPTDEDELLRELLVACDGVSIPVFGMAPVGLFSKLLRKSVAPTFAVESRRIIRVQSEQVPKRLLKNFKTLQGTMKRLSFHHNFFGTIPAIGPIAVGMMSMITRSGQKLLFGGSNCRPQRRRADRFGAPRLLQLSRFR